MGGLKSWNLSSSAIAASMHEQRASKDGTGIVGKGDLLTGSSVDRSIRLAICRCGTCIGEYGCGIVDEGDFLTGVGAVRLKSVDADSVFSP